MTVLLTSRVRRPLRQAMVVVGRLRRMWYGTNIPDPRDTVWSKLFVYALILTGPARAPIAPGSSQTLTMTRYITH